MPHATAGTALLCASTVLLCGACAAGAGPDAPPDCVRSASAASVVAPNAPAAQRRRAARGREEPSAPILQPAAQIPLPGPAVRFDYQSLDTAANRLVISHMGAGELVLFDVARQVVIDTVGGMPAVTGVLVAPDLGKIYASATGLHRVMVLDTAGRALAQVGPIGFPDGIAYAPEQQKIYVSDESGGGELVIDGPSNQLVTTIGIGGEAGNTVFDAGSRCILVAVQTQDQIVAIDPRSDRIIGRYSPAGMATPHGLLVDPARRLLFVANQRSAVLAMVDLTTMRTVASQPVGAGPDVLAFDPGWQRLYVGSESGVVSVFTEANAGLLHEGDLALPNAHTVAVDPRSHLVYLPLEDVAGQPVLWIGQGTPP